MDLAQLEALFTGKRNRVQVVAGSYPCQDLRTSEALSLLSEVRLSALPVGVRPHPDLPYLSPLVLLYSQSQRLLETIFTSNKLKNDWIEAVSTILGLFIWGNRRIIDLQSTKLAKLALHLPKTTFIDFHAALISTLQSNLQENITGFIQIITQIDPKLPFYLSFDSFLPDFSPDILLISFNFSSIPPLFLDISLLIHSNQCLLSPIQGKEMSLRHEIDLLNTEYAELSANFDSTNTTLALISKINQEKSIISALESVKNEIEMKKSEIENRISGLKAEIESLYANFGPKSEIFAFCGLIGLHISSNCYYFYLQKDTSWFKFTSQTVLQVDFSEITSILTHKSPQISLKFVFYTPKISSNPSIFPVNFPLPELIDSLNKRFDRDFHDFKDTEKVLKINELYSNRIAILSNLHHKYREANLNSPGNVGKYEVMNFPYFLKMKAEENLSKWVVLDECLREIDDMSRGLSDFDERNAFILKLKSQLLTAWREVPRFLFISLHEKLQLERLLDTFYTSYRELMLSLYTLSHINQGNYHSALCALGLTLHPLPPDPSNYLKTLKDACKVLSLRLISLLNRDIHNIETISHLSDLRNTYIDPNDIHCKQITLAVDAISSRNSTQIELNRTNVGGVVPEDLKRLVREMETMDVYSWMDLTGASRQFGEEVRKMREETLVSWVKLHLKLTTTKQVLGPGELDQLLEL